MLIEKETTINQILTTYPEAAQFFNDLHAYRNDLEPVVEESFSNADIELTSSLLYKFLHAAPDEVGGFFTRNVTTMSELQGSCQEFIVLFKDMQDSMTTIFEKGRKELDSIKKPAKTDKKAGA